MLRFGEEGGEEGDKRITREVCRFKNRGASLFIALGKCKLSYAMRT